MHAGHPCCISMHGHETRNFSPFVKAFFQEVLDAHLRSVRMRLPKLLVPGIRRESQKSVLRHGVARLSVAVPAIV